MSVEGPLMTQVFCPGYAADGYARIKGASCLITTFGVGELSALNAMAGAMAEYVPVVHISATPSTISQRDGMLLHHTLGNGDFNVFANMSREISCVVVKLNDPHEAPALIDHALRECWIHSRPAYIALPSDMVQKQVEGERLKTPIDLTDPQNDQEKEDYVVDVVMKYLYGAKRPIILVDACAIRHRVSIHRSVLHAGATSDITRCWTRSTNWWSNLISRPLLPPWARVL